MGRANVFNILKRTGKNSAMKRKLLATALILISVYALLFIWLQQKERVSFESHFLNIMKRLNTIENRTRVRSWFQRPYNFTELCQWVHANLEFVPFNETFERHTDPAEILHSGKGRCEEFSILYVSACLAHEHQGRLVAATDVSNPLNLYVPHVWTEVELSGYWVHVDPSEQRWNETNMYQSWKWG